MISDETPIVMDSCTCINLAAALELNLSQLKPPGPTVLVPQVVEEALFLHDRIEDEHIAVAINLSEVAVVTLNDQESELYVCLAQDLDDGEAASLAVAHSRSWILATDDRTAIRHAAATNPPTRVITTAQILRWHAETAGWHDARISKAVRDVLRRASFVPPNSDPEYQWWTAHL